MAGSLGATLDNWLGSISQYFGQNGEHGVDVALPYGSPVYAPAPGVVGAAGYDPQIGGVVSWRSLIHYGGINGPASLYIQHLSQVLVAPGQTISAGQLIGYSGGQLGYGLHPNTSNVSTGPHIEFGINSPRQGPVDLWQRIGANVNPLGFLQALARGDQSVATSDNYTLGNTGSTGGGGGGDFWGGFWSAAGAGFGTAFNIFPHPDLGAAGQAVQSVTDIPGAIGAATAATLTAAEEFTKRAAFFIVAILIIIVGVWLLAEPGVKAGAEKAAGVADLAA